MLEDVPRFNGWYPTEDGMDQKQLIFYKMLEKKLSKGLYVDIDGQISYLFVYIYKLLDQWNKNGFENLYDYLIYISEIYAHENKFSDYCRYWAYDCLLGLNKLEIFLEKTEPVQSWGSKTHFSNTRLNIQKYMGLPAHSIDLLLTAGGRKSKFIVSNAGLYKDSIEKVFSEFISNETEWFELFDYWEPEPKLYPHSLFCGAVISRNPTLSFNIQAFYAIAVFLEKIKTLSKEAESIARVEMGLPRVGEGWISETILYEALKKYFFQTTVVQHGKPEWLKQQHFDIWFPDWKIAVEYHGEQHFRPIEFFGGDEAFAKNVERDERKLNLAKRHGVKLLVLREGYNLDDVLAEVEECLLNRKIEAPRGLC